MAASPHPAFSAPSDENAVIWRYMDFTKFLAMLESATLYFARADLLGDPFEGSYARENERQRPTVYKDIPPDALAKFSAFAKWIREWTYVNCWHMNALESAAMWQLYTKTRESIAIRSTFALLRDALPSDAYVGVVNYIDYDRQWLPEGNVFYPFLHKRQSFAHERELRAMLQNLPKSEDAKLGTATKNPTNGRLVPVDLVRLVSAVYVAPSSADWFYGLVQRVVERHELRICVHRSCLDDAPFF